MNKSYKDLKDFVEKLGINLFGVADISKEKINGLGRAISIAVRLSDKIIEEIKDRPTKLYFHHYGQANNFLDQASFKIANFIQEKDRNAMPIPASQIIDWENQKGEVSHKKIAYLAGLGWLGRNNLIVNPKYGARIRFATILTDMDLPADKPLKDDCGDCKDCLPVCPVSAIKESQKNFDHIACFNKLKEFRNKGYVGQYICGICVKACYGLRRRS